MTGMYRFAMEHNEKAMRDFIPWYDKTVSEAIMEVVHKIGDNADYKEYIATLESSFKKPVKGVVLVSKNYTVFIYPRIDEGEVEAVTYSDIFVIHHLFRRDNEEATEEYVMRDVDTGYAVFMLTESLRAGEENYKDWKIDFTCLYHGIK